MPKADKEPFSQAVQSTKSDRMPVGSLWDFGDNVTKRIRAGFNAWKNRNKKPNQIVKKGINRPTYRSSTGSPRNYKFEQDV